MDDFSDLLDPNKDLSSDDSLYDIVDQVIIYFIYFIINNMLLS